jgi:hypothetical protein
MIAFGHAEISRHHSGPRRCCADQARAAARELVPGGSGNKVAIDEDSEAR